MSHGSLTGPVSICSYRKLTMIAQTTTGSHRLTNAAIYEILHGTMPDGSPIRATAKVEAMLAAAGIENAPQALKVILGRGVVQGPSRSRGRPTPRGV